MMFDVRHRVDSAAAIEAPQKTRLKAILIAGDALALAAATTIVLLVVNYPESRPWWNPFALVLSATAIGLVCLRSQGLFLARVSAVRIVEFTKSTRALAMQAAAMVAFDRVARLGFRVRFMVAAAVLSWLFFIIERSVFRAWVTVKRSRGHHQRQIILVGADSEVARLVELFSTHVELGISVQGIAGDHAEAMRNGLGLLWLGEATETEALVEQYGVSGVVVSPASLTAFGLKRLIRNLQHSDIHVHLATGVSGIDASRLRHLPMSYEPLFYVEAPTLSRVQLMVKRVFDLVVSSLVLLIASPLFLVVALCIKLQDRGPVFFRQERVGRDGSTFKVLKFRTMRVNAEALLAQLRADNERTGPLFKMESDPRVTKIGKLLRDTSLDELPQLWNVIRGEMSVVGPRPALPSEVKDFGADLRRRELVLPGITGLWQVEARDNPSFEAYRRLDLFYVENWSMTLDLMIVLGTVEQLVGKAVMLVAPRRKSTASSPKVALVPDAPADTHSAPGAVAS